MGSSIAGLSDADAINVLRVIVANTCEGASGDINKEMTHALVEEFSVVAHETTSVSEGELARQALSVLAKEPSQEKVISALIDGPKPEAMSAFASIAVGALVVMVLKSHFDLAYKDGKISFKWQSKAWTAKDVNSLVEKLFPFLPKQ